MSELDEIREINAHLPFHDPIAPSIMPRVVGHAQFMAEFYPPELYEYNELGVPVRAY